jgi:peptidylprolyl isomerase
MVQAQPGSKVKVHYTGRLADGKVFDSSLDVSGDASGDAAEIGEPLEFVIGSGQMIPAFEQSVIGMEPGESKTVSIPDEQAYGLHNPRAMVEVERSEFPPSMPLEVGSVVQGNAPSGEQVPFTVVEVTDSLVTLDRNHPLAGKDLTFEIKLVEVG